MSERAPVSVLPLFAPPASEQAKGNSILAGLAERRRGYLTAIRQKMRALYQSKLTLYGEHGASVSPDDARKAFELMKPPPGINRNFLATVFREPGWEIVGTYVSETKGGRGNKLNRYRWVGTEEPPVGGSPATARCCERMNSGRGRR